jgi:hypothetical protein
LTAEGLWVSLHGVVSLRIHKPGRAWSTPAVVPAGRVLAEWGLADRSV